MGELCYIIFNLATTTKIRLGEIFNLERDCILEKYEQAGVIQYYSKGTGNQKIKLTLTIEKINLIDVFSTDNIEHTFKAFTTENELGMGAVLSCMRLILTGKGMGPAVFAIASLLGKDEVMNRYQNKIKFFTSLYENKKQVQ